MVVEDSGVPVKDSPYLVKEVGINRYERITGTDFSVGLDYWTNTAEFWKDVRNAWAKVLSQNDTVRLKSKYNDKKLYEYLFEYAYNVNAENYESEEGSKFATTTINNFIINKNEKTDNAVY